MTEWREHWNNTYAAKVDASVSWYQADPLVSLRLIRSAASDHSTPIIDVGGGASRLIDRLIGEGYSDLTVLDISEVALARSKTRLGELSRKVSWIVCDVTEWKPHRSYAVWHDRAVFHFLTDTPSQDAYIRALTEGTMTGSAVMIATFAPTGPERCSGLPVERYSAARLAARLGAKFQLYDEVHETHQTPFGTAQEFVYAAFRRR